MKDYAFKEGEQVVSVIFTGEVWYVDTMEAIYRGGRRLVWDAKDLSEVIGSEKNALVRATTIAKSLHLAIVYDQLEGCEVPTVERMTLELLKR